MPMPHHHDPSPHDSTYDAIVVGARCAGATTAMLLARGGMRVLAVDRARYGSDTLSTHAMLRPAVYQLGRWGLLDRLLETDTPPVRTTTFHYGERTLTLPIEPRDGVPALFAPRRTLLDALLVDAARAAGAEVRHGLAVRDLLRGGGGRVQGVVLQDADRAAHEVRAPLVIGADGRKSTLARRVAAEPYRLGRHCTTTLFGYFSGLDVDGYHWHFNHEMGGGSIPTNGGSACVFVAAAPERFGELEEPRDRFHRLARELDPALAERVARARPLGALRRFGGAPGYLRTSHGPGWALVGDAGYFKDPLTAHGITDAFRDAELLARAVLQGDEAALGRYQEQRDALSIELFELTERIASFQWDLSALEALHVKMGKEAKRELAALQALEPPIVGEHVAA